VLTRDVSSLRLRYTALLASWVPAFSLSAGGPTRTTRFPAAAAPGTSYVAVGRSTCVPALFVTRRGLPDPAPGVTLGPRQPRWRSTARLGSRAGDSDFDISSTGAPYATHDTTICSSDCGEDWAIERRLSASRRSGPGPARPGPTRPVRSGSLSRARLRIALRPVDHVWWSRRRGESIERLRARRESGGLADGPTTVPLHLGPHRRATSSDSRPIPTPPTTRVCNSGLYSQERGCRMQGSGGRFGQTALLRSQAAGLLLPPGRDPWPRWCARRPAGVGLPPEAQSGGLNFGSGL
jgi:hypothetical protein